MKTISQILVPSALAALLVAGCGSKTEEGAAAPKGGFAMPAPTVAVETIRTVEVTPLHRYSGRILSPETVSVVSQVAGTILEVAFTEGTTVKKGDLLYRIDDVKYVAAVAAAKAAVAQCEASADYAEKTFARTKALFDKNVASADDMDSASSARATAAAALDAAKAKLVLAEDDLAHCRIVADIDGKIGLNAFAVGNYVTQASGPLTTIVRQDPLRVRFSMASGDLLRHYGDEATLRSLFQVRIRQADGELYPAEGEIEFTGNAANATTDTISIFAKIPNPDGTLVPGGSVGVEVSTREPLRVLAVPLAAVLHNEEGADVWVVGEGNMPEKRAVKTSFATASHEVVEEGLKEGETIIVGGTHKVIPGMPVQPVEPRR